MGEVHTTVNVEIRGRPAGNLSFCSTMWGLGFKLGLLDWAASAFTIWSISPALELSFIDEENEASQGSSAREQQS